MATLTRIPVSPEVIKWARESAGLDIPTAAARIGVKPDRVEDWEAGVQNPTINQARSMADAYERPLAALFMAVPLAAEPIRRLPDFRRPSIRASAPTRALQKAIMRAYRQRDALQEVAQELGLPSEAVTSSLSLQLTHDSETNGGVLRDALQIDELANSTLLQPEVLLRELVRRAEDLNITVIQVQRVDVLDMRGFSLGDGPSPVIALNGADWPRGKVYTLMHELAHVGFHSDGLCDLQRSADLKLERKCDEVAAAALMPADAFLAVSSSLAAGIVNCDSARVIGNQFGVSGEAALLRMVDLGRANWDDYWRLKPEFDAAYRSYRSDQQQNKAGKDSPIYYPVKARDLGRRFIRQMLVAHGEDVISSRDLVQLLEVTYDKVPKLARMAGEDFS